MCYVRAYSNFCASRVHFVNNNFMQSLIYSLQFCFMNNIIMCFLLITTHLCKEQYKYLADPWYIHRLGLTYDSVTGSRLNCLIRREITCYFRLYENEVADGSEKVLYFWLSYDVSYMVWRANKISIWDVLLIYQKCYLIQVPLSMRASEIPTDTFNVERWSHLTKSRRSL